ncbi:MAG: hypothetical protein AAF282_00200 [Cyanobacteria bacterium P01_A01_bin.15]
MARIKDTFLRRLLHSYSRYILLIVVGSSTLLLSFDWSAETSLLSAAGLGVLIELLLSRMKPTQKLDVGDEMPAETPVGAVTPWAE